MEEARCGAVCPGTFLSVLMIGVKCSRFRAKAAHISGHLPDTEQVCSFRVRSTQLFFPSEHKSLLMRILPG